MLVYKFMNCFQHGLALICLLKDMIKKRKEYTSQFITCTMLALSKFIEQDFNRNFLRN